MFKIMFVLGSLLVLLMVIFVSSSLGAVTNFERVSVGTGDVESNHDSFYLSLSEDGSVVAFESFASNWGPDQIDLNFVDIFARDRNADVTRKLTVGYNGDPADQRSFDPFVSADGRYISFISYATNLVPGDTNRLPYVDNGLDVFLYDWQTGSLERVSLTWKGEQIDGNSVGQISPNGEYAIFSSNGLVVAQGESNVAGDAAIYVRHLQTGVVERITKAPNGDFPDGNVARAFSSYDGRFIVYISNATNLVPDTNGHADVMIYDQQTGETTLISKPVGGGQSNGKSSPAAISADGRYIAFRSFADNLVPNDTNGVPDIFVYDRLTGELEMVSVSTSGVQSDADSKDPAICGNGRFISFTSEATTLVPLTYNGERQVYVHDRLTQTTFLATGTETFMGNGRAHRSILSADCRTIGFATDAGNLIVGDDNGERDLFVGDIVIPANLEPSQLTASGNFEAGAEVTYTVTLTNIGTETAVATFSSPIPTNTTYVSGSVSGASYNGSADAVEWTGNVPGEGEVIISYTVQVNPALTDFTLITNQSDISYDGKSETLEMVFAVNGLKTYLPLVQR
ncbi:hypothetical protein [Candidatus Leptofilum sp.]|uniref:hypothetical protein n=1 Tax=Candidatus Leptofilum sp. TaxID=3241576 RepID=UPI003B5A76C8